MNGAAPSEINGTWNRTKHPKGRISKITKGMILLQRSIDRGVYDAATAQEIAAKRLGHIAPTMAKITTKA